MLFRLSLIIFGLTTSALGEEIIKNLPAGGSFVFSSRYDRYTINCTADPVEPTVISEFCACRSAYIPPNPDRAHYLTAKFVLSNGESISSELASAANLEDCLAMRDDQFARECAN